MERLQNKIKKCALLISVFGAATAFGQGQLYDNFDGTRALHYGERTGVLDTIAKNPAPGGINTSEKCGLYVRNGAKKFANIKMNLPQNLTGVEAYATYLGIPPKLKMKVYTSAPAGTLVEILLGSKRGNNDYPAGTHSQYQAYTTKSNEWEELEFKFSQIPQGSETSGSQIDQVVLLFNPNSSTSDTYYFDDLTGPTIAAADKGTIVTPQKIETGIANPEATNTTAEKIEKPVTKKDQGTKKNGKK
ncbi:MAG: glycoside hydrolase family protein [Bacteroidetes bacterium]|jgi:hypothetical protein|nr:glycoside hydrolase family protein [Bacteroidota bacterium]